MAKMLHDHDDAVIGRKKSTTHERLPTIDRTNESYCGSALRTIPIRNTFKTKPRLKRQQTFDTIQFYG